MAHTAAAAAMGVVARPLTAMPVKAAPPGVAEARAAEAAKRVATGSTVAEAVA